MYHTCKIVSMIVFVKHHRAAGVTLCIRPIYRSKAETQQVFCLLVYVSQVLFLKVEFSY